MRISGLALVLIAFQSVLGEPTEDPSHVAALRGMDPNSSLFKSMQLYLSQKSTKSASPKTKETFHFECDNSKRKFSSLEVINDDYCDCQDGSDEPGTSACPNGRFFCRNQGHIGSWILSSRVNDGICDQLACCDGSDEYDGRVQCPNTCNELHAQVKQQRDREAKLRAEGIRVRNSYAEYARDKLGNIAGELQELQTKIDEEQLVANQLRKRLDEASGREAKAQIILNAQNYPEKLVNVSRELQSLQSQFKLFDQQLTLLKHQLVYPSHSYSNFEDRYNEADDAIPENFAMEDSQQHILQDPSTVEKDPIKQENNVPRESAQLEQTTKSFESIFNKWSELYEKIKSIEIENDPIIKPLLEEKQEKTPGFEDENTVIDEDDSETSILRQLKDIFKIYIMDNCALPIVNKLLEVTVGSEPITPLSIAQQVKSNFQTQYDQAQATLRQLRNQLEQTRKRSLINYGPDDVFLSLDDQCFQFNHGEYIYEICPFHQAYQKKADSEQSIVANLGTWQEWSRDPSENYSIMRFVNGAQCWNGPARSMTVYLACGAENRVLSASEPNKCEYQMEMLSPAVCFDS